MVPCGSCPSCFGAHGESQRNRTGLLLSEFLPSRRFAELTGVTMLGALVGDLFLLPACLMLMWKRRAD